MRRRKEAREVFECLLALPNDVALLSEEYDPKARRLVGNFPQTFSHVPLIDTARKSLQWYRALLSPPRSVRRKFCEVPRTRLAAHRAARRPQ
jgi:hypothetical protein